MHKDRSQILQEHRDAMLLELTAEQDHLESKHYKLTAKQQELQTKIETVSDEWSKVSALIADLKQFNFVNKE